MGREIDSKVRIRPNPTYPLGGKVAISYELYDIDSKERQNCSPNVQL